MKNINYLFASTLFFIVAGTLLFMINKGSEELFLQAKHDINQLQTKRNNVAEMTSAARDRSIVLLHMLNEDDPFERDDLAQVMSELVFIFRSSRESLKVSKLTEMQTNKLAEVMKSVVASSEVQNVVTELMAADELTEAKNIMFKDGLPLQAVVLVNFRELLALIDAERQKVIDLLQKKMKQNSFHIFELTALLGLMAMALILLMVRRIKSGEKRLTQSEVMKDSLLNSALDSILMVDENNIVKHVNQSTTRLLGLDENELLGRSIEDLIEMEQSNNNETHKDVGAGLTFDSLTYNRDGETIPVHITVSDTKSSTEDRFLWIVRDVTNEKKAEEALKQRAEELEDAKLKYKELSEIDPLTQLPNRRYYENRLTHDSNTAKRHNQPVSVLMIDIDHFKLYNDHYGHGMGDETLIKVASAIRDSLIRKTDMAARYGGEEFVVILPFTDSDGGQAVAERIRKNITELNIEHVESEKYGIVTISLGLATLTGKHIDEDKLLKFADDALYNGKESGRNCCSVYVPSLAKASNS